MSIVRYSVAEVTDMLDRHFPQARGSIGAYVIEEVAENGVRVRLPIDARYIRPGGSVSGPTLFTLADLAIYVAILAERGEDAVEAVTSSMTINFLARPKPADLICQIDLLRSGRRMVVADARLYSDGETTLVAHATGTYMLPERSG